MILQPGDCLLFRPTDLLGQLVAEKTWHAVSHAELYAGDGKYLTARWPGGVRIYTERWPSLAYVLRLRPAYAFNFPVAVAAFLAKYAGQPFNAIGFLRFVTSGPLMFPTPGYFCSEVVTHAYREGGVDPFNGDDAAAVPPYLFLVSNCFEVTPATWETVDAA